MRLFALLLSLLAAAGPAGAAVFGEPAAPEQLVQLKTLFPEHAAFQALDPGNAAHLALAAPLLRAETALAGRAPTPAEVLVKAQALVSMRADEAVAVGDARALAELEPAVALYQPENAAGFQKASARAMRLGADIAEQLGSVTLAPSVVSRYHRDAFGQGSKDDTRGIYERFLAPLPDKRAKQMLHALLMYAGAHPETLQSKPYASARDYLVESARELSREHDAAVPEQLSAALAAFRGGLIELPSAPAAAETAAEPETAAAREEAVAPAPARAADLSSALDYFPGWPELGEQYGDWLESGRMRLVKLESDARRKSLGETVYQIYVDGEPGGSYTVRRLGDHVERNVLFTLGGRLQTFGVSHGAIDDWLRGADQQWTRLKSRLFPAKK